MDLGLVQKKALVTGASRGLGRSIALSLAHEGAQVAVVARDKYDLYELVDEMGGRKAGHLAVTLDLMAEGAIRELVGKINQEIGSPEILVHNVGGTLGLNDVLSGSDDYQKVWRFNLGIAVELNRWFIPGMEKASWGRIVHISSSSAIMADASLPYSSAKAALNTYVKGLGKAVAGQGIIVSAVMPGPFRYPDNHWDRIAGEDPERYDKFIRERMAVRRIGSPEEISGMVTYLCSQQASYFAGAVIPVDGGIY